MQTQEHQPELRGAWRKSHVAFSFKYLNGRIELTDEARTVSHARKNQVQMQQIRKREQRIRIERKARNKNKRNLKRNAHKKEKRSAVRSTSTGALYWTRTTIAPAKRKDQSMRGKQKYAVEASKTPQKDSARSEPAKAQPQKL